VSKEADFERLARVLAQYNGFQPADQLIIRHTAPWVSDFGTFEIISDLHQPEPAWRWFTGVACAILQDGWIQPAPTVEPEPEGVVNPDLPGFEFGHPAAEPAPATLEDSWRTRMGLA
jgi:hypothetical protein